MSSEMLLRNISSRKFFSKEVMVLLIGIGSAFSLQSFIFYLRLQLSDRGKCKLSAHDSSFSHYFDTFQGDWVATVMRDYKANSVWLGLRCRFCRHIGAF